MTELATPSPASVTAFDRVPIGVPPYRAYGSKIWSRLYAGGVRRAIGKEEEASREDP
jgi:hypothetical protein